MNYQVSFQVWRGASYLIIFNWVCAVVCYLLTRWKINYKLVLLEDDKVVGSSSKFFKSSCFLTAIYLVLFLIELLHRLQYIQGYEQLDSMAYFMWIINTAFFLNPLKVLNYNSRFYFLTLIKKILLSPFNLMNMLIFFVTMILGSFAQPLNDFIFTLSSLAQHDKAVSQWHARLATFIILSAFFVVRIVQGCRLHAQFGMGKCFSKSRMRLLAVICSILTIIPSFLYALYPTE